MHGNRPLDSVNTITDGFGSEFVEIAAFGAFGLQLGCRDINNRGASEGNSRVARRIPTAFVADLHATTCPPFRVSYLVRSALNRWSVCVRDAAHTQIVKIYRRRISAALAIQIHVKPTV